MMGIVKREASITRVEAVYGIIRDYLRVSAAVGSIEVRFDVPARRASAYVVGRNVAVSIELLAQKKPKRARRERGMA